MSPLEIELLEALKRAHEAMWVLRMRDDFQSDHMREILTEVFSGPIQAAKTAIALAENQNKSS